MAAQSRRPYDVSILARLRDELTTAFSEDPSSFSRKLLAKGLISEDPFSETEKGSSADTTWRRTAKNLVSLFVDKIMDKPELFQSLLQVLEEEPRLKEAAEKIKCGGKYVHAILNRA